MTLQEIFVLNNILDGKDVYSLPPLSKLSMTQLLYNAAKDLLIKRGFLKNSDELTDEGVLITKRLMSFKAARKYIMIMGLTIGIVDKEQAVMMKKKAQNNYLITLIDIKNITEQFFEVFDFIKAAEDSKTLKARKLEREELEKEYSFKNANFELKTKDDTKEICELCFCSDNQLYIYNCGEKMLYPKSYEDVIKLFEERLVV